MRRREFISLVSGAAATLPLAARAQQAGAVRRVVVLMGAAETAWSRGWLAALLRGLDELGWRESRNLFTRVIEWPVVVTASLQWLSQRRARPSVQYCTEAIKEAER